VSQVKEIRINFPIYDDRGTATGEISIGFECPKCHALTFAPKFHDEWHEKLRRAVEEREFLE